MITDSEPQNILVSCDLTCNMTNNNSMVFQRDMIPNRHNFPSIFFWSLLLTAIFIIIPQYTNAADYNFNHNPQSYVLEKIKSNDIVLLGTRHKQPAILNFISEIIAELHDSGVTHICLEIASDQQGKIDQFIKTRTGLSDIQIHFQIDCPEYRNLFKVLKNLNPNKRQAPVVLDLPNSKYGGKISRDEWMAESIAAVFKSNPNAKMLVVVGNNHVLKKLDWQDKAINKHRSIREYLSEKRGGLRFFSIAQVIGESVYEDDFRREFGYIDGAVAIDLDERYAGWILSIEKSQAIKSAGVWELLDGVIVY